MPLPESQNSRPAGLGATPILSRFSYVLLLSLALLLTGLARQGAAGTSIFGTKKSKQQQQNDPAASEIDRLMAVPSSSNEVPAASAGSTYSPAGSLSDLGADFRARHLGDVLTVVVSDSASAVVTGGTSQKRASSATASIPQLFGNRSPSSALSNLASLNGNQQLAGTSSTSRTTTLSTTLSVRVVRVLPNGDLVVEGNKLISINSESQTVTLRGIVRQTDLGPTNSVGSGQVADIEVRINGRGVVNDAIRRPNILYRLLLGILPF
jgi:flagellar L-ring protein FlgH